MGKPFEKELNQIDKTISWANSLDIKTIVETISKYTAPVYIIGSGGSFSACQFAANLFASKGIIAKAVTPLELFFSGATLINANLIFISASGKNTDILFGFKNAAEAEPISILNICMKKNTKLGNLSAAYSNCRTIEFENPAGKDGFLATNSLIAYFVVLYRAITDRDICKRASDTIDEIDDKLMNFVDELDRGTTVSVLYSSFSNSVAVDIESKCTEAGLCPILLSDYRNFAHGRHHWFDKQDKSAIIMLVTPMDDSLASRTIGLLPESVPRLILSTNQSSFDGIIDLLIRSFNFINVLGKKLKIDPGRPGVPEYGSKLYNLRFENLVKSKNNKNSLSPVVERAILRKAKKARISDLSENELTFWTKSYEENIKRLSSNRFGCIIFDYDGTLCSQQNRETGLTNEVSQFLISLLKAGIIVGVVSGRGKSLRTDLIKIFSKNTNHLKKNLILGYYNGSDIAIVTEETKPDKNKPLHKSLAKLKDRLAELSIEPDESPNQLTIGANSSQNWGTLKPILINEIMLSNLTDIQMVESSHSIDILPRKEGCKNNIIAHCIEKCKANRLPENFLCIGDKGQWPGNDYALLANKYSLSVGEVSGSSETCWNICPPGIANVEGLMYLQSKFTIEKGFFTLQAL